ncbi:unnamed protein product [Rhizoctonia solani]|nr:unnamed protein product [Rhizoctonia solani]
MVSHQNEDPVISGNNVATLPPSAPRRSFVTFLSEVLLQSIIPMSQDGALDTHLDEVAGACNLRALCLESTEMSQAEELFDGVGMQLDYMEDCGLKSGRVHVLGKSQRHDKATTEYGLGESTIIIWARCISSYNDPKLLRRGIEKALKGLWILFPLSRQVDVLGNPVADALIQCLKDLSNTLTEGETHELEVFQAIHAGDQARIRSLARFHSAMASNSAYYSMLSLLCLPRSSSSLVPAEKWSIYDFINTTKLTLKYLTRISDLAHNLDISDLSTQKLLGIQPEDNYSLSIESKEDAFASPNFRIYSTSPLYEQLLEQESPCQSLSKFNHAFNVDYLTAAELGTQKLALDALHSLLRSEISKVHEAASSNFQVMFPCLEFAVFGKCIRPNCGKQHLNNLSVSKTDLQTSYNLRIRSWIMQIQLVDKYVTQTILDEIRRRNMRRTLALKMYETLMPLFPPLEGLYCMDSTLIPELDNGVHLLSVWCHQALFKLDPCYGAEGRFLSDALMFIDLAFRLDGGKFTTYVDTLGSSRLVKTRQDLMTSQFDQPSRSIMHDLICFYRRKSQDCIQRVVLAIQHIVGNNLIVEINLLVNLLEFVGREIIVQHRMRNRGRCGLFDGLVVPHSWALDLIKRPPLIAQTSLWLKNLMEYLVLYSFHGKATLNLLGRGILIERICRLIVLVANNTSFTLSMKENARCNISRALTGPGEVHHYLCDRIVRNSSWADLESTIIRCPLNRGADQLVHLLIQKSSSFPQPRSNSFIRLIVYTGIPELTRLLSLTDPIQQLGPRLNPLAEPLNPELSSQPFPMKETKLPDPEQVLGFEEQHTADSTSSDSCAAHFDSLSETSSRPVLTPDEVESGKKILLAYRRYIQRRLQSAAKTIWSYYSRYRHIKNKRAVMENQSLKLRREYEKYIMEPEGPLLSPRLFSRHNTILLRCMPHVVLFLRGLEHVNQLQKQLNRERLRNTRAEERQAVRAKMHESSQFTRKLRRLMSSIMPGSGNFLRLNALQAHVKEISSIYQEVQEAFGKAMKTVSLEQHYYRGVAVILAQPTHQ